MHIYVYKDADEVCNALAKWIAALIDKTLEVKEIFTLVLSGGETPKKLYQILSSSPYNEKIKWHRVHIFWGDERGVPFDDDSNNAKMAFDNLIDKVTIKHEQVHKIRTDIEPNKSAKQYEKILHQYFDNNTGTFDLVLLGMGDDGHTLSLFPGNDVLNNETDWVRAVTIKDKGERITLLPPVVNRSGAVAFLVTGRNKAKVLAEIISNPAYQKYPAQLIQPANGELYWFIDEEAATEMQEIM